MSVRKSYACDLCNEAMLEVGSGIGILHQPDGSIKTTPVRQEGVGHHICFKCTNGLRPYFIELLREIEEMKVSL